MKPDLTQHRQVLDACAGQIQSLTELARACAEAEQPLPADEPLTTVRTPLTEEAEAAIVVLYRHGHSLRDIGGRIGLHPQQVSRILDQYDVPRRPRMTKKLSDDQRHQIVERYRQGESANIIARDVGVAVSTVVRYVKAAGVSTRGDLFKPTFDQQVFKRLDQPDVRYWLGYLSSARCEVSDLVDGGETWFRVRVPFSHEEHLKGLRRLLMAPQDKTKLVRSWETVDGIVLRVESRPLVEQLHRVGIVHDFTKRSCRVRESFFSPDYWRGLVDAVGVIEPGKLSVMAGPLLSIQLIQYARTLVPDARGFVDGDWVTMSYHFAEQVLRTLFHGDGVALPAHRQAVQKELAEEMISRPVVMGQTKGEGSDVTGLV